MNAIKILIMLTVALLVGIKSFAEYLIEICSYTLSTATSIIALIGIVVVVILIVFCLLLWLMADEQSK